MTVLISKPSINLREALKKSPSGIAGEAVLRSDTEAEAREALSLDNHETLTVSTDGVIADFESTGIDDNATSTKLTVSNTGVDVTGTVTADGADLDGAVVINESGADVDFRVESDNNTHALFVDAGNDRIGINNSNPSEALDVVGNIEATGSITGGALTSTDISIEAAQPKLFLQETDRTDENYEILVSSGDFYIRSASDDRVSTPNVLQYDRSLDRWNFQGKEVFTSGSFTGGAGSFTTGDFSGEVSIPTSTKLFFDGGSDTSIRESSSNVWTLEVAGADQVDCSASTFNIKSNNLQVSTGGAKIAGDSIIGSSSLTPDGTLHVHSGSAGTVTANSAADDVVIENSADGGLSVLVPDASTSRIIHGSPTAGIGAFFNWNHSGGQATLGSNKVGASLSLQSDASVDNLTLSGASGSEVAEFAGSVGIGSSTPSTDLHILNGSTAEMLLESSQPILAEGQLTGTLLFAQRDASGSGTGTTGKIGMRSATRLDNDSYFGNVADMAFYVSGSSVGYANDNASLEAMTIRAGGDVGIRTTDPDGTLHVHTGSAGSVTADSLADDLIVENTQAGISILSADANSSFLAFGSPGDNRGAAVIWNYDSSAMYVGSDKVGASLLLRSDNGITNLTLSGGSGNELAEFAGDVTTTGSITVEGAESIIGSSGSALSGRVLTVGDSGNSASILNVYSANTGVSRLEFGDPDDVDVGRVNYDHPTDTLSLFAAGSPQIYFRGAGGGERTNIPVELVVGDASLNGDGTAHIYTGSAGTVTAAGNADDLVVENSASGGASLLVPDASTSSLRMGSPSDSDAFQVTWNYDASLARVLTEKVGASLSLRADNNVPNLTLSGASGSELGVFEKRLAVGGGSSITADFTVIDTNPIDIELRNDGTVTDGTRLGRMFANDGVGNFYSGIDFYYNDLNNGEFRIRQKVDNVNTDVLTFVAADATFVGDVDAVNFNTTSDRNLKENIERIAHPVEKVAQLNGYTFDWKSNGKASAGLIAQEVEGVLPEAVKTDEDGVKRLNYDAVVGLLVETINAQQQQLNKQQEEINELKKLIG